MHMMNLTKYVKYPAPLPSLDGIVWAIIGSRDFEDWEVLSATMDSFLETRGTPAHVISGGAKGADTLGQRWAVSHDIPHLSVLPDWEEFGRSAGPLRNKVLVEASHLVLAFVTYNVTPGTASALRLARSAYVPSHITSAEEFYLAKAEDLAADGPQPPAGW